MPERGVNQKQTKANQKRNQKARPELSAIGKRLVVSPLIKPIAQCSIFELINRPKSSTHYPLALSDKMFVLLKLKLCNRAANNLKSIFWFISCFCSENIRMAVDDVLLNWECFWWKMERTKSWATMIDYWKTRVSENCSIMLDSSSNWLTDLVYRPGLQQVLWLVPH